MLIKMKTRCCNRCQNEVAKSQLKQYAYQCFECDEDLYEFETHLRSDEYQQQGKEKLKEILL